MARNSISVITFIGVFLFSAVCGADEIAAKINLVFEDGRVMIYQGPEAGLKKGATYEVVLDGGTVGEIKVTKVEDLFTMAEIKTGAAPGAWEGREVQLVKKGKEKAEKPKKEKKKKEKKKKPKKKKKKIEERIAEKEYDEPVTGARVPVPEPGKKGDHYIANSMLRYETHDSSDAPDDYINYMLLVSRPYHNDVIGNAYIYNSYNSSQNDNSMTLYGLSVVKLYPRDVMASIGYAYMVSHASGLGGRSDRDTDVFSLNVSQIFSKYKDGDEWSGALYYSNTEGYIDSASLTGKLTYQHIFDPDPQVKGRFSLLYNHNPEDSRHVSTQFSAQIFAQWRPRTKYSLEFLHTNYARDRESGQTDSLDNDNVLRFSIYHRH